jgi:hypothetical protein
MGHNFQMHEVRGLRDDRQQKIGVEFKRGCLG